MLTTLPKEVTRALRPSSLLEAEVILGDVSTVFSHASRYFIRFVILSVVPLRGRLFRFFVFLFPCPVQGEVLEDEQAMESCHVLGHGVACVA